MPCDLGWKVCIKMYSELLVWLSEIIRVIVVVAFIFQFLLCWPSPLHHFSLFSPCNLFLCYPVNPRSKHFTFSPCFSLPFLHHVSSTLLSCLCLFPLLSYLFCLCSKPALLLLTFLLLIFVLLLVSILISVLFFCGPFTLLPFFLISSFLCSCLWVRCSLSY